MEKSEREEARALCLFVMFNHGLDGDRVLMLR